MKQFEESKIIALPNKQTLSYDFYQSILNKDTWKTKTYILYGEKDKVVDKNSIFDFLSNHNATLSIMKNGDHYFHTPSQLRFIKKWITKNCLTFPARSASSPAAPVTLARKT